MDDIVILEEICKKLSKRIIENSCNSCIVCLHKIGSGVLLIPCSHCHLCTECFEKIDGKCPECRSNIEYYLEYHKKKSKIQKTLNSINQFQEHVESELTDEIYEMDYILYHINNRHLPYSDRVLIRRLDLAGYNTDSIHNSSINRQGRFRTWWP